MIDIVNFQDRLDASHRAQKEYSERMELTAKMIPVMVDAVEKMRGLGASNQHIARFLRATIEELQER